MTGGSANDHTWPKHARLLRRVDYVRTQSGLRLSTRDLVVRYCPVSGAGPRIGLTVSRKVGNAVVRNQVKRWLRESLRQRKSEIPSMDLVVIARNSAARADYWRLDAQIETLLHRIGERV